MFSFMFVFLILIAVLMCIYFRKIILNALGEARINTDKRLLKIIVLLISIFIGIAACNIFSFSAVFLIHLVVIALICDLFYMIAGKRKTNPIYRKLHFFRVVPIFITFLIMIYGYINLNNVEETSYSVKTDKNIGEDGYRIALIADVHYGVSADKDELTKICNEIGKKDVDIVILCGDIVDDNTTSSEMREVFSVFSKIRNTSGIYYVYGNHDRQRYSAQKQYSENELAEIIEENNIRILKDEVVCINDELVIIGREDASSDLHKGNGGRKSISELLKGIEADKYIVVADHQPKEYKNVSQAGADLILSGHTHGGQIWPVNIIDDIFKINDANYGYVDVGNGTAAIVTSGLAGWNYPIKTAAPAEYVIVDIVN